MELLLLLILPIAWLVLLPGRLARGARRFRFTGASLLVGGAIALWVGLQIFAPAKPPEPQLDYAAGDTELRSILLQPETAPRYSSRE